MNTIIKMITSQDTLLESSLVVFWMLCVVLFFTTLVYGIGWSLIRKRVRG
jgi:hypothetical protein